jgi:hypothetical protein
MTQWCNNNWKWRRIFIKSISLNKSDKNSNISETALKDTTVSVLNDIASLSASAMTLSSSSKHYHQDLTNANTFNTMFLSAVFSYQLEHFQVNVILFTSIVIQHLKEKLTILCHIKNVCQHLDCQITMIAKASRKDLFLRSNIHVWKTIRFLCLRQLQLKLKQKLHVKIESYTLWYLDEQILKSFQIQTNASFHTALKEMHH